MPENENESPGYRELVLAFGRDPVGTLLDGRYILTKHIASGGMGEVFEATHKVIEGRVVIKFLRPSLAGSPELFQRFVREAGIAAEEGGEVIARVRDFQVYKDIPYMVAEYLDGKTLAAALSEGRIFHAAQAAQLLHPVCLTLRKIHARGIVHRDIKPSNLMLMQSEGGEHLKLLDFGISLFMGSPRGRKLTESGIILGTAAYMSPEQADGSGEVDYRTDIYALGCVFYEMVTGHPPFEGKNYNETILAVVTRGYRDPRDHVPGISERAVEIIDIALKKDRGSRFTNAHKMADALKSLHADRAKATGRERNLSDRDPTQRREMSKGQGERKKYFFVLLSAAAVITAVILLLILLFRNDNAVPGADSPEVSSAGKTRAHGGGTESPGSMIESTPEAGHSDLQKAGSAGEPEENDGAAAVHGAETKKKVKPGGEKKTRPYYGEEIKQ